MPRDYTLVASRLSATGTPDPWWRAQRATVATPGLVPVMPERYSPSSSRTGRRTHRIVYRTGDVQIRMPSNAAINRYLRDNPSLNSFDVPAELLSGGRRGMGMLRVTRSEETGRFEVTGGSGAYGGDGEWAQRAREAANSTLARRRPRASMPELRDAAAEAERRLRGSTGGAVAGDTTARLVPELTWQPVTSSALTRVGYDPISQRMEVEFHNGSRGTYRNVSPAEHAALMSAPSIGSYYTRNIRSNPRFMGPSAAAVAQPTLPRATSAGAAPTVRAGVGAQNCPDCGQFVGEGAEHACVGAAARNAALRRAGFDELLEPDPLAAAAVSSPEGAEVSDEESDFFTDFAAEMDAARAAEEVTPPVVTFERDPGAEDHWSAGVGGRRLVDDLGDAEVEGELTLRRGIPLPEESGWRAVSMADGEALLTTINGSQFRVANADPERMHAFIADPANTLIGTLGSTVSVRGQSRVEFPDGTPYTQAALVLGNDSERPQLVAVTNSGTVVDVPLASMSEWDVVAGGSTPNPDVLEAISRRQLPISADGIEMMPMASTALARAGYDPATSRLRVEMHDGRGYTYEGVDPERWRALQHAESQGRFYGTNIARQYPVAPDMAAVARTAAPEAPLIPLRIPSPAVHAAGYDPSTRTLRVQIAPRTPEAAAAVGATAQVYRYESVDPETYAALISSDRPGHVFSETIRSLPSESEGQQQLARARARNCPGCGQYLSTGAAAHHCPGPAASGADFVFPRAPRPGPPRPGPAPSSRLASAAWANNTARLTTRDGDEAVVSDVTEAEFNRLVADPDVTFASWRANRRLSADNGSAPAPNMIRVPYAIRAVRSRAQYSNAHGVDESLHMPPPTSIRDYARSHRDETFDIPVRGSLADPETPADAERFGQAVISGHVRIHRDARGRLQATDDGLLEGGTPQQRRQMAQAVTAMLQARRVTGEFSRLRAAHLATTERLRGSVEASRAARAAAEAYWSAQVAATSGENSWAASPDKFQAHYEAAKARKTAGEPPIPYMRENATGGLGARDGGRAFGVEIEFDLAGVPNTSAARAAILRDLKAEGVIPDSHPDYWMDYGDQRGTGYTSWMCTDDSTVSGEIVSPIMYDEPKTWEDLEKVCEIVKRHGGKATARTGNHVHVGCGDFDHTVDNHNRLLRDHRAYDDVLQRLGTNPERGTHRRNGYQGANGPVPPAGYRQVSDVQVANRTHNADLNFGEVTGSPRDHVEFRQYDGTLDPAVIQAQIKISLGLTSAAFAGRNAEPGEEEPLGSHRAANPGRRNLDGEEWERATAGLRRMLDRLFHREEDKAQITALFSQTRWQAA